MGQPINLSNRIGFIFDCDGTLLDTTDAWLSMEDVFAARVGAHITPDQRKGLCTMTMPEEAMWLHTMLGVGNSVKELEQEIDDYFMDYYSNQAGLKPGAMEIVESLACRGIPCSIASSSPHAYLEAGLKRHRRRARIQTRASHIRHGRSRHGNEAAQHLVRGRRHLRGANHEERGLQRHWHPRQGKLGHHAAAQTRSGHGRGKPLRYRCRLHLEQPKRRIITNPKINQQTQTIKCFC